jgi:hypothetical protein
MEIALATVLPAGSPLIIGRTASKRSAVRSEQFLGRGLPCPNIALRGSGVFRRTRRIKNPPQAKKRVLKNSPFRLRTVFRGDTKPLPSVRGSMPGAFTPIALFYKA